jgi:hypothetical protein
LLHDPGPGPAPSEAVLQGGVRVALDLTVETKSLFNTPYLLV